MNPQVPRSASVLVLGDEDRPWTWIRMPESLEDQPKLDELVRRIRGRLLLLDVSRVERVGSAGAHAWRRFLEQAHRRDAKPVLVGASASIVDQLNIAPEFGEGTAIFSVLAPYFCPSCELEHRQELHLASLGTPPAAPERTCLRCGEPAEFDDVERVFFRFLAQIPLADSDLVAEALAELEGEADKVRVARIQQRSKTALVATTEPISEPLIVPPAPSTEPTDVRGTTRHTKGTSDLLFYVLMGVVLAGLALVALKWGGA